MTLVGMVAIGRNEGERLRKCLSSLTATGTPVVYVDSGSTDNSVPMARQMGVEVLELDMSIPFSAARARNAGLDRLLALNPQTEYVHFFDGDCILADGWLDKARQTMDSDEQCAVVCGQRRELHPDRSVYNRFCDIEWAAPAGEVSSCGGDAMMRIAALREIGGFDPSVPAGEEPEMCQRLRQRGWRVIRLDADMTWHDAAMLHFHQWWRRQFRTGYNGLDVSRRFGLTHFSRHVRSARLWTIGLLATALALSVAGAALFGTIGLAAVLLLISAVLILQAFRISRGKDAGNLIYGLLTLLSKWAQLFGHLQYYRDSLSGRQLRLIEYKTTAKPLASLE